MISKLKKLKKETLEKVFFYLLMCHNILSKALLYRLLNTFSQWRSHQYKFCLKYTEHIYISHTDEDPQ